MDRLGLPHAAMKYQQAGIRNPGRLLEEISGLLYSETGEDYEEKCWRLNENIRDWSGVRWHRVQNLVNLDQLIQKIKCDR